METTHKIQIKSARMSLTFAGTARSTWDTEMLNLTLHPMKKSKWKMCTKAHKACFSHRGSLLIFLYFAHLASCPLSCHPYPSEQQLLVVLTEAFGASSAAKPWQRIPVIAMGSVRGWGGDVKRMLPGHFLSVLATFDILFYYRRLPTKFWLLSSAPSATLCFVYTFSSICFLYLSLPPTIMLLYLLSPVVP